MPPAIKLHNISKTFTERNWKTFLFHKPQYTKALSHVSLTVPKGQIMGLLGPNGAGKTTLIKILATLVSPDEGTGEIAGYPLTGPTSRICEKIGLVGTNDRSFYWRLTGLENLNFFAALYNLSGAIKRKRIEQVLELTGMQERANFKFMAYSAGQKQRLSIARALLSKPDILLLDEATASLDPIATRKLLDFTKKTLVQKENKTIIWCTHNLHEADEICDNLTILHHGQVLHSGSKQFISKLLKQRVPYSFTVSHIHDELKKQADFQLITENTSGTVTCYISINQADVPILVQNLTNDGVNIFECTHINQGLEPLFNQLITTHSQVED
jgi:ABC-2 type transport system ATP-binding protein